jgi:hypothetical protein
VDRKDDIFRTVSGPVIALDYSQSVNVLEPSSASGPTFVVAGKKGGPAHVRGGIGNASSTALTFMLSTALVYRLWGIKASSTYPPGVNQSMGVSLYTSTQT